MQCNQDPLNGVITTRSIKPNGCVQHGVVNIMCMRVYDVKIRFYTSGFFFFFTVVGTQPATVYMVNN